jgi:hypothetical protein
MFASPIALRDGRPRPLPQTIANLASQADRPEATDRFRNTLLLITKLVVSANWRMSRTVWTFGGGPGDVMW